MGQNVTIYQIAKEAGVSVSTVSRILTGSVRVADDKRETVEAVILKHNYRPNPAARNPRQSRSKVLGFILPDVAHPYFENAFLGAESRAIELGYLTLLGNTMNDNASHVTNVESRILQMMLEKRVDGIIMMGGRVNEPSLIPEHREEMFRIITQVPVVTAGGRFSDIDCCSVEMDEEYGIDQAINYLVALGHRQIGFLGGKRGINPSDFRMDCLRGKILDHGMSFEPRWVVESGFTIEDGQSAMESFLMMHDRPTALLCFNDLIAIGALYVARKNGIRVPEDLSIIGMDNIPLAEYIVPQLTTVDLDPVLQGSRAVDLMVAMIEDRNPERRVVIQPRLVIRDSCHRPANSRSA
jgi:DNA-binding LacI/PurR family transcriptional regulator